LDLPQIQLADLPDEFEVEIDCEPLTGEMTGESEGRLRGDTDGVTEGVTVGIDDLDVDFSVDEVKVDGVSIDSADSGLPLPSNLFPIELEVDTELEGEAELQGDTDIDDSFIEFIPMITGGSVGFNDKIEIKMHYDGDPKDATISPRAIISAPSGTSCNMSIESPQADEGLPLPFTFDSVFELPAGDFTITIEPQCEGDCSLTFDDLFITIEGTTSVIPDCLINDVIIDGVSSGLPPAPFQTNFELDFDDTLTDTLTITGECTGEATSEGQLRGDGVTEGVTDGVTVGVGEAIGE
jgi:hypothetical protein